MSAMMKRSVRWRVIEGSGHIASLFIDVAGNFAMGRIRTALQFERAQIAVGLL
jgi:hypothetical protein